EELVDLGVDLQVFTLVGVDEEKGGVQLTEHVVVRLGHAVEFPDHGDRYPKGELPLQVQGLVGTVLQGIQVLVGNSFDVWTQAFHTTGREGVSGQATHPSVRSAVQTEHVDAVPGQHTHVRPVLGDFSVLVVGPLFGILDKTRVVEGGLGRRVVGGGPGPYATGKFHRGDRALLVELFPVGLDVGGKGVEEGDLGVVVDAHGE